jgi:uncharacterized UPF0160 family protein
MIKEDNPIFLEEAEKIIIHDELFHADDLLAAAFARLVNPNVEIIRTRNPQIIKDGLEDKRTIVADVGFGQFDHHQVNAKRALDGHKMSGCGLLFERYGEQIIASLFPAKKIDKDIFIQTVIEPIEWKDNWEIDNFCIQEKLHLYESKYSLSPLPGFVINDFVRSQFPAWNSQQKMDDVFYETLDIIEELLHSIDLFLGYDDILSGLIELTHINNNDKRLAKEEGIAYVKGVYDACRQETNNVDVIKLPYTALPWREVLPQTEVKFIWCDNTNKTAINICAVPTDKEAFDQKISIPLNFLDGIKHFYDKDMRQPFVHPNGYIAVIPIIDNEKIMKKILTKTSNNLEKLIRS